MSPALTHLTRIIHKSWVVAHLDGSEAGFFVVVWVLSELSRSQRHFLRIQIGHEIVGLVDKQGEGAKRFKLGDRVGVPWLYRTCGKCKFCLSGRENLCDKAQFTGFDVNGGYAELMVVDEDFAYAMPDHFSHANAAPLLCAGVIGFRALRLSEIKPGQRLGLYGFGASAHVAIQVAVHWGCEVYVFSRSEEHRRLARKLGASWTGTSKDKPPAKVDSAVHFAPSGPLTLDALMALEKGGTLALASIYMSTVPEMDYQRHLYNERTLRSVTAATRHADLMSACTWAERDEA